MYDCGDVIGAAREVIEAELSDEIEGRVGIEDLPGQDVVRGNVADRIELVEASTNKEVVCGGGKIDDSE